MNINVSSIKKINGATLNVELCEVINQLSNLCCNVDFKDKIHFKGMFANLNGVLKLTGKLKASCSVICSRCLKNFDSELNLNIEENFAPSSMDDEAETYIFAGDSIEIDKALTDNILLNLPKKQICSLDCKGLCQKCGKDLNIDNCDCELHVIDSRMTLLKNLLDN